MIGLVLVAHAHLASGFRQVIEHVMGAQDAFETVDIGAEDNIDLKRQEIAQKIALVDQGAGVVLLTDMFGGTPSNLAISFLTRGNLEVIAGVNVPMLVKLVTIRQVAPLQEAVDAAQVAAKSYINVASHLLSTG